MRAWILAAAAVCVSVVSLGAQGQLTAADIQRLQDAVYDAGGDVSRLRDRDPKLAESLQRELDELREEVIYLKVKLRKESSVARSEYSAVRDRIDRLRSDARGEPAPATASTRPPASDVRLSATEVPVGTEFDVRLQSRLNSGTARVEDRFDATTIVPYERNGRTLVPAGSVMRGVVSSVDKATRTDRKGALTVAFDQVTIRGRAYPIRATVTQAIESEGIKGEAAKIGAGAGVGAIIGGILGGAKGALLGVLIGGGGTIAATEGKDAKLPAGTVLRVRFDQPLTVK